MKLNPTRFHRVSRITLLAAACLAPVVCQVPDRCSADDTYIDASTAIQELHELALAGKSARVVLETMNGREVAIFAQVGFSTIRSNTRVVFYPHFTRRPGAATTLVEEWLGRPLTNSADDRELADKKVIRVQKLDVSDKVMVDGNDRYLVKSIDELNMDGPQMPVATKVWPHELSPSDPWIGDREDDPSNWEIKYTIEGFSDPFQYRIDFMNNPKRAPIDSVTVYPAAWRYDTSREQHVWSIRFTVRQGANRPYVGFFDLDDYGYPIEARFGGRAIFDKELSKRLSPRHRWALWVKNHEFESPAEAWDACPGTIGNRSEMADILYDLLSSVQNPDIRLQVLGAIQASHIIEKRTVPLVKASLDSPYEDEVSTAKSILARYAQEQGGEY